MTDLDEEIDLPNTPLDEYMRQFELENNDVVIVPTVEINVKQIEIDNPTASCLNLLFYDEKYLKSLFSTSIFSQVLTNDDENFLYNQFLLHEANLHLQQSWNKTRLYTLIGISSGLLYIFQFYVLLVTLLCTCVLLKYTYRFLFQNFLKEIYKNMGLVQNLFIYLKQVHLLKLNVTRSGTLTEDVNKKYRQLLFVYLRVEYFCLKKVNLEFLTFLRQQLKLTCTIEQNELSDVLKVENNDEKLAELTSNYHLNIINCLIKLNYMQMSELTKLIVLIYLQLDWKTFFILLIRLVWIVWMFRSKNKSLKRLIDVFKLKEAVVDKQVDEIKNRLNVHINSLSMHLRNALLNSYMIMDTEVDDGLLKVVEYELDFCLLYLKQIKKEIPKHEEVNNSPKITALPVQEITLKPVEIVKTDVFDFIFEAMSNENLKDLGGLGDDDEVDVGLRLETREFELVNSNFYSELKEALVKKKDEWSEREKNAKIVKDEKLVEYEKQFINTNNLLIDENDLLRYKSQVRSRKRTNQRKYQYDGETCQSDCMMNKSSFLSEFKIKKSEIYEGDSGEDNDEIIYE
jgi:hypothetical protein